MAAKKGAPKQSEKPKSKVKRATSKAKLIKMALQAFEKKLANKNVTVGDFVKLIELEKEIGGRKPREIKVTWVDPKPSCEK
jgi:hypothetical protein